MKCHYPAWDEVAIARVRAAFAEGGRDAVCAMFPEIPRKTVFERMKKIGIEYPMKNSWPKWEGEELERVKRVLEEQGGEAVYALYPEMPQATVRWRLARLHLYVPGNMTFKAGPKRPWSPEEIEAIRTQFREGKPADEFKILGKRYPELKPGGLRKRLRSIGIITERRFLGWRTAEEAELKRLRREGVPPKKIAKKLGRTQRSVVSKLRLLEGRVRPDPLTPGQVKTLEKIADDAIAHASRLFGWPPELIAGQIHKATLPSRYKKRRDAKHLKIAV